MTTVHGPLATPITRRASLALLASTLGACAAHPAAADQRLLFITDQSYPVINHGGGTQADLVLVSTTRPR